MNMLMIIFHEGIITLSPLHGKGKLWCLHASTEPNTPTWVKRGLSGLCGFLCGFGTVFPRGLSLGVQKWNWEGNTRDVMLSPSQDTSPRNIKALFQCKSRSSKPHLQQVILFNEFSLIRFKSGHDFILFYLVYKRLFYFFAYCAFFFFLFHLTLPINLVADGTGRYVLRCIYRWFTLSCSASDKITTWRTAGCYRSQRGVMYMQMAHADLWCH